MNTEHKKGCTWGDSDCGYKKTHHYCPHEEHKSLECKCFEEKADKNTSYLQKKLAEFDEKFDEFFFTEEVNIAQKADWETKKEMIAFLTSLYNETIDEVGKLVPPIRPAGGDYMDNDEVERCRGHNSCREEILTALSHLKDEDKKQFTPVSPFKVKIHTESK